MRGFGRAPYRSSPFEINWLVSHLHSAYSRVSVHRSALGGQKGPPVGTEQVDLPLKGHVTGDKGDKAISGCV